MRQVRTCDFCDDPADGVYEPLPPAIAEGPRLLLCEDCLARLQGVVDPLLDALEAGRDLEVASGDADEPASPDTADRSDGAEATTQASAGDPADPAATLPEEGDTAEMGGRPPSQRSGTPTGYRTVMRFLENRALPIERTEAVELAAAAYDLDDADVEAALDHAVQYGRLREVDGELKR